MLSRAGRILKSVVRRSVIAFILSALGLAPVCAQDFEHFEKRIRPLLAEKCYACHSAATTALGDLRLDSRDAARAGGTRGPAVVPGQPEASWLLKAVSYTDLDVRMPPRGKLSDDEIAALRRWIADGAADPREDAAAAAVEEAPTVEDGRNFWAFQPVDKPAVPAVARRDWVLSPVDAFILRKLDEAGLEPAAPAGKAALLRRVTFDLTGLPPTRDELESFLADSSPDAFEAVVERLLASPQYGERWARHWLDLVRYAETNGHEFDNNKLDAWRYRDYVVRAFNQDLPYDTFLTEQIAGDLLPKPRVREDNGELESPIGSGFWWLWEVLNSPTDSVKARADQVDNQIDVLSKSMLGMTLACARCHDHKFDPLPTRDYYSIAGILHSTQLRETLIDGPARRAEAHASLQSAARTSRRLRNEAGDAEMLSKLRESIELQAPLTAALDDLAAGKETAWTAYLREVLDEPSDPLYPLARLSTQAGEFPQRLKAVREEMDEWVTKSHPAHPLWTERDDEIHEEFGATLRQEWELEGYAFSGEFGPRPEGVQPVAGATGQRRKTNGPRPELLGDSLASGAGEATGILFTRKFVMPARYVHVRMSGTTSRKGQKESSPLRFTIWADDHPSAIAVPSGPERYRWHTLPMVKERGRECYLQIVDRSRTGHIAIDQIVFSDDSEPPPIRHRPMAGVVALLERDYDSRRDVIAAYEAWARTQTDPAVFGLLAPRIDHSESFGTPEREVLTASSRDHSALPVPAYAMSSMDDKPRNIRIHNRGNHKNLGDEAPRQFLTVIAGEDQEPFSNGSGRLELAEWVARPENPLTARVMVNRVWKHHFGQGIVRSVDNFGKTGDRPTHPELLDYLAAEFVASGWSIKHLHRSMVLSSTYRMSSRASASAEASDPDNKLLSHMPVRRLEAEAIRDTILELSGRLDRTIGGPPVAPHISEYQDGRGKPKTGPLDGDGRRSLYVGVRRNFLTPLFLAFDYPLPTTTAGRRGTSAVPAQALILLNNEFVNQQAQRWGKNQAAMPATDEERLDDMYWRAFARAPTESETADSLAFLATQAGEYGEDGVAEAWGDLAHVLVNSAEFIFVP